MPILYSPLHVYVRVYMCVCKCVYVYVCMFMLCVCMCVYVYVCMYVCMYTCVCMYVCMYVCTYVCMYVCVLNPPIQLVMVTFPLEVKQPELEADHPLLPISQFKNIWRYTSTLPYASIA
jgi:hypothetical protein